MSEQHVPVLLNQVLDMADQPESAPESLLDCTFGRGGHALALAEQFQNLKVFAVDQDRQAIEYAQSQFADRIGAGQLHVAHGSFHRLSEVVAKFESAPEKFDLILADLGVSSPQLDQASRGFSFQQSGPLDMRMNQQQELTAATIVNTWSETQLRDLFYHVGEVRKPGRVVKAILRQRESKSFETTLQLADLIAATEGWRKKGWHPATQYFLALRIEVNQELEPLEQALKDMMGRLGDTGRLLVITFHSLEDRIVKNVFKAASSMGERINKKVLQATWEEKKSNPRARSAKLRGFVRRHQEEES
jgi:16S rRNA (cytosine1402-N4)-methyltransferase